MHLYNLCDILFSLSFLISTGKLYVGSNFWSKFQHFKLFKLLRYYNFLYPLGKCCDDLSWSEVEIEFQICVNHKEKELLAIEKHNNDVALYPFGYCR